MSAVQTNLSMSPGDRELMQLVAEVKGWSLKTTITRGLHALVRTDPELAPLRMRLPSPVPPLSDATPVEHSPNAA